jgi:hypothetical protein
MSSSFSCVDIRSAYVQEFWPQLSKESCVLPPWMQRALDAYHALYHNLNNPRKLRWAPAVGQVRIFHSDWWKR